MQQTFSELWYRVADFRPSLSPHLTVRRQVYRHETWFVLGDPASSKFYRFNAPAYRFLGLLDGRRTVQEAWDICNAQLGDDAPTQRDCIELLSQLQLYGLLRNDLPVDPQRLRERFEIVRRHKWEERTGKFVFWTVPLFNPERFLSRYANVWRALFSRWGLLGLVAMVIAALWHVLPRWNALGSQFNQVIALENLVWVSLAFLALKAVHELAHGAACKAFGGRVTEIGLFFLIVVPVPYCDATASWAFPNKWHRIVVSAAGMMAELAIASVAAIVWARTEPGFVHTMAFNVMFIASVVTILFNINPLLRYDGYYMLSDFLEIPNMTMRSRDLAKWCARRYLFGVKGEPMPPIQGRGEAAAMLTHAALAFPYRLLVVIGIVMMVAQRYFVVGVVLAALGFLMWLVVPVVKALTYVISDNSLQTVRARAVGVTFGLLALAVVLIGFMPAPNRVHSPGVVEPMQYLTLRAAADGFLTGMRARNGDAVEAGREIVRLSNPLAEHKFEQTRVALETERLRMDAAIATSPVDYRLAHERYRVSHRLYEEQAEEIASMTMTAPFAGQVIAPDLHAREGAFVKEGDPIARIATLNELVVRAYIDDSQYGRLIANGAPVSAEARLRDDPGRVIRLVVDRMAPAGTRALGYRSLGATSEGGEVAMDPTDPHGQHTLAPQYQVTLRPAGAEDLEAMRSALPGTRARVRFVLEPEPLARQWWRRLRQEFAARFDT